MVKMKDFVRPLKIVFFYANPRLSSSFNLQKKLRLREGIQEKLEMTRMLKFGLQ